MKPINAFNGHTRFLILMSCDCYAIVNKVLLTINFLIIYTETHILSIFTEFEAIIIQF